MSESNSPPWPTSASALHDDDIADLTADFDLDFDLGFDGAEDILRVWRQGMRPDADLTVSQWADKHRKLSSRASAEPGQYRTSRTPYLREIMDALSPRHPAQRISFMKAAQVGATEAGNNWIGFVIHHAPGPMLAVLPTVEMAKRTSRGRIDPLIEDSPALRERVQPARSRDAGNSMLSKEFPGGILVLTGANSATGLRSMPARYIFLDEVDAYPASADDEGDPVTLAEARTTTFSHRRKVFMVSTPTVRGLSRIEREFEASDQRRYFVPCPHCGHHQWLQFERLRWAKRQPQTAMYHCEGCERPITRIDTATLRQATQDVRDFGVVVSDQDAAQIERTNDAISRLGLIWRGLSNQLAVAAAPALETAAGAMAAVARTTGPLGIGIRMLFENLGRLAAYATGIATLMAGRFVASMIAAAVSVRGLAMALVILRGALLRLPLIGLVVAAGELVYWFGRLVQGAGGFGNALSLLGDLAREVWERMHLGAVAMGLSIMANWAEIKAAIAEALQTSLEAVVGFGNATVNTFQGAFDAIKVLWGALPSVIGDFAFQAANALIAGVEAMLNGVGSRINGFLDGINAGLAALGVERQIALIGNLELGRVDNPFAGSAADAGTDARAAFQAAFNAAPIAMPDLGLSTYVEKARGQAEALRATMTGVVEAATAPLGSIAALREAVAASGVDAESALTGARTAAEGLEDVLDAAGDTAGRAGGAGRGAGQALREAADTARDAWTATADAVRSAQERSREIAQGLAQDIVGPIKDALKSGEFTWETFASAISRIAQNLANRLIESAFKPIENAIMRAFSGGGGGGGIGGFIGGLFGFAKGGVFAGGQELTAFARGGVVNRPTVFPFAQGIGLMGEAGPEAILPLRRGRDGRLGVEMNGGAAPQPAQDMSTRIINVLDPSVVGDYLTTPSGERAILNVIRRNRSALNA